MDIVRLILIYGALGRPRFDEEKPGQLLEAKKYSILTTFMDIIGNCMVGANVHRWGITLCRKCQEEELVEGLDKKSR